MTEGGGRVIRRGRALDGTDVVTMNRGKERSLRLRHEEGRLTKALATCIDDGWMTLCHDLGGW
jgi:hypothetical protein